MIFGNDLDDATTFQYDIHDNETIDHKFDPRDTNSPTESNVIGESNTNQYHTSSPMGEEGTRFDEDMIRISESIELKHRIKKNKENAQKRRLITLNPTANQTFSPKPTGKTMIHCCTQLNQCGGHHGNSMILSLPNGFISKDNEMQQCKNATDRPPQQKSSFEVAATKQRIQRNKQAALAKRTRSLFPGITPPSTPAAFSTESQVHTRIVHALSTPTPAVKDKTATDTLGYESCQKIQVNKLRALKLREKANKRLRLNPSSGGGDVQATRAERSSLSDAQTERINQSRTSALKRKQLLLEGRRTTVHAVDPHHLSCNNCKTPRQVH